MQQANIACSFHAILEAPSSFCDAAFSNLGCYRYTNSNTLFPSTASSSSYLLDTPNHHQPLSSRASEDILLRTIHQRQYPLLRLLGTYLIGVCLPSVPLGPCLSKLIVYKSLSLSPSHNIFELFTTLLSFLPSEPYCPSNSLAHQLSWLVQLAALPHRYQKLLFLAFVLDAGLRSIFVALL
jgi:hypothetical protein